MVNSNFYFGMLSGPFAIIFYSVEIFQNTGDNIDRYLASIIVVTIRVLGGILGIFLIQKLDWVRLSMVTMTMMSVSMAVLGTTLYLKSLSFNSLAAAAIFIVTKYFLATLSYHGTYWLFAAVSLSSNFFYFFFMSETRGKTALEIKQMFQNLERQ